MNTRVLLLLICLAFHAAVLGQQNDKKSPRIDFAETTFDFGKIEEGQVVEHVFAFTNSGNDTLRIGKIDASCGCTAALASDQLIAPGGRGEIKASFNSAGRMGKTKKSIYVRSNDPGAPMVTLSFTVDIMSKAVEGQSSVMDVLKNP